VIAIAQHGAVRSEDAIHNAREPGTECLHAAAEFIGSRRLDHEVRVIGLDRVLDDAELASGA
jgi:hypothetical protein